MGDAELETDPQFLLIVGENFLGLMQGQGFDVFSLKGIKGQNNLLRILAIGTDDAKAVPVMLFNRKMGGASKFFLGGVIDSTISIGFIKKISKISTFLFWIHRNSKLF